MWYDIEDRTLPAGVITVDKGVTHVIFGAKTVRAWGLKKYETISPKMNDNPDLVASQFYEGEGGKRRLRTRGKADTRVVSCANAIRYAGAEPGRYWEQRRDGWITVDFRLGKVDQFSPRRKKHES